jgi:hypothetical protein
MPQQRATSAGVRGPASSALNTPSDVAPMTTRADSVA